MKKGKIMLKEDLLEMSQVDSSRQMKTIKNSEEKSQQSQKLQQSSPIISKVRERQSSIKQIRISQPIQRLSSMRISMEKGDQTYQISDLAYTFLLNQWNPYLMVSWLVIVFLLRYYTFGCLVYVLASSPNLWEWVFVIFGCRFIYFLMVVKTSIKIPQTRTQIFLKNYWNSTQDLKHQLFAEIDKKKFFISLFKGIIPPQLCFFYIKTADGKKRFTIYSTINFMYCGIQSIIYYPFFIIYCAIINQDNQYALNVINKNFTIFLASLGQIIIVVLCLYLLYVGIKRKYGWQHKFNFLNSTKTQSNQQ